MGGRCQSCEVEHEDRRSLVIFSSLPLNHKDIKSRSNKPTTIPKNNQQTRIFNSRGFNCNSFEGSQQALLAHRRRFCSNRYITGINGNPFKEAVYTVPLTKRYFHATGSLRLSERNYYDILGVPKDAGRDDIRKAFQELAKKYHPGTNKNNPSAKRKFQEIRDAYEPQIGSGDKIIMPPSTLDCLASLHIDYPMLFELRNDGANRVSHCGVLEFIAEEGMIYMPYWMMENMLLQEGDIVRVKSVSLPKGTYANLLLLFIIDFSMLFHDYQKHKMGKEWLQLLEIQFIAQVLGNELMKNALFYSSISNFYFYEKRYIADLHAVHFRFAIFQVKAID